MKTIDTLTRILVLVGALNWGLVGIANFDLVSAIMGAGSVLAKIVYSLVGISAVAQILFWSSKNQSSPTVHARSRA